MVQYTSIQLMPKTRESLIHLKSSKHETYDELINKLMRLIPTKDDEGEYTDEFRAQLLNARIGLNEGKLVGMAEVERSLGL